MNNYYLANPYQKRVEIYGIDDWVNPDENIKGQTIKIYHVHGIVSSERDDTCPIIFSENSYQEFQQGMLNWSNVRLAESIGKNRVLCVGFSGTDTSFRSLCHQLKAQRRAAIFGNEKPDGNHIYLALTCEDIIRRFIPDPNWAEQNRINAFYGSDFDKNKEYAKRCLSAYFNSVKAYYDHQLGVVPLWFKDFDKLAAGIKSRKV